MTSGLWIAVAALFGFCLIITLLALFSPGPHSRLGHEVREAERVDEAALARPHLFEQDPASGLMGSCRCGRWHWHHLHTGDCLTCACDDCRAFRGGAGNG